MSVRSIRRRGRVAASRSFQTRSWCARTDPMSNVRSDDLYFFRPGGGSCVTLSESPARRRTVLAIK